MKYGKGSVKFDIGEKNYMGSLLPIEIGFDLKGEE
jgi:hypothetical protein